MKIVNWPNEILNTPCPPVEVFDNDLKSLAKGMTSALKFSRGLGLAAPQVGHTVRMCIIMVGEIPLVMVNPTIIDSSGWIKRFDERCLSFPGKKAYTKRKAQVMTRYRDLEGNIQEHFSTGTEAICVQHEIDHLNGITLTKWGIQKI